MASCFELDLGTLAFQESVTECAFGLGWDGVRPAGDGGVHGGSSCAGSPAVAAPWIGVCGSCSLSCAMPLVARERTAASNVRKILVEFKQRFMENSRLWLDMAFYVSTG